MALAVVTSPSVPPVPPPPSLPPSLHTAALVDLFFAAGGPQWERSARWLDGEPCIDAWEGITCCPESSPFYDGSYCHGRAQDSAFGRTSASPTGTTTGGSGAVQPAAAECSSELATGTARDRARCVVVSISLGANNLTGSLNGTRFDAFPHLRLLDLEANRLRGSLPPILADTTALPHLASLRLADNQFDYGRAPSDIFRECSRSTRVTCTGLPQHSCSAFEHSYRVALNEPGTCVRCGSQLISVLAITSLALFGLIALLSYAFVIARYHGVKLQRIFATVSILLNHIDTVQLLLRLRLKWPQSARLLVGLLGFELSALEAARVECLLAGRGSEEFTFHAYSLTKAALPLALLAGIIGLRLGLRCSVRCLRRGCARRAPGRGGPARTAPPSPPALPPASPPASPPTAVRLASPRVPAAMRPASPPASPPPPSAAGAGRTPRSRGGSPPAASQRARIGQGVGTDTEGSSSFRRLCGVGRAPIGGSGTDGGSSFRRLCGVDAREKTRCASLQSREAAAAAAAAGGGGGRRRGSVDRRLVDLRKRSMETNSLAYDIAHTVTRRGSNAAAGVVALTAAGQHLVINAGQHLGKERTEDELVVAETLLYEFLLVDTWETQQTLIVAMCASGGASLPTLGGALALGLLGLEAALAVHYYRQVETLRTAEADKPDSSAGSAGNTGGGSGGGGSDTTTGSSSSSSGGGSGGDGGGAVAAGWRTVLCGQLPLPRVRRRMKYMIERYATHARRWQFFIWARQAALFGTSLVPDLEIWLRSAQGGGTLYDPPSDAVVVAHALLAIALFVLSLVFHCRVQPYVHQFQNRLEGLLYLIAVLMLTMAAINTVVPDDASQTVDLLSFGVLAFSLLLVLGYIVLHHTNCLRDQGGRIGELYAAGERKSIAPAARATAMRATSRPDAATSGALKSHRSESNGTSGALLKSHRSGRSWGVSRHAVTAFTFREKGPIGLALHGESREALAQRRFAPRRGLPTGKVPAELVASIFITSVKEGSIASELEVPVGGEVVSISAGGKVHKLAGMSTEAVIKLLASVPRPLTMHVREPRNTLSMQSPCKRNTSQERWQKGGKLAGCVAGLRAAPGAAPPPSAKLPPVREETLAAARASAATPLPRASQLPPPMALTAHEMEVGAPTSADAAPGGRAGAVDDATARSPTANVDRTSSACEERSSVADTLHSVSALGEQLTARLTEQLTARLTQLWAGDLTALLSDSETHRDSLATEYEDGPGSLRGSRVTEFEDGPGSLRGSRVTEFEDGPGSLRGSRVTEFEDGPGSLRGSLATVPEEHGVSQSPALVPRRSRLSSVGESGGVDPPLVQPTPTGSAQLLTTASAGAHGSACRAAAAMEARNSECRDSQPPVYLAMLPVPSPADRELQPSFPAQSPRRTLSLEQRSLAASDECRGFECRSSECRSSEAVYLPIIAHSPASTAPRLAHPSAQAAACRVTNGGAAPCRDSECRDSECRSSEAVYLPIFMHTTSNKLHAEREAAVESGMPLGSSSSLKRGAVESDTNGQLAC